MASPFTTISSCSISLPPPLQVNRNRVSGLSSISFFISTRSVSSLRLRQGASRFRVSCSAKPETLTKVCDIVRKQLALPRDSAVTGESKFAALGADSLDTVEIVMGLEEEFGISVEEETAQAIATVQDVQKLEKDKKIVFMNKRLQKRD